MHFMLNIVFLLVCVVDYLVVYALVRNCLPYIGMNILGNDTGEIFSGTISTAVIMLLTLLFRPSKLRRLRRS